MVDIKLEPWVDLLNSKKTRNESNCRIDEYNCGGYATGTYHWLCPYNDETDVERQDYMEDLIEDGYTEMEVANKILEWDFEFLQSLFEGRLRKARPQEVSERVESLIAYRIASDDILEDMAEFHFRVIKNGEWWEKCGAGPIEKVPEGGFNEPWDNGCLCYDSEILYLILD